MVNDDPVSPPVSPYREIFMPDEDDLNAPIIYFDNSLPNPSPSIEEINPSIEDSEEQLPLRNPSPSPEEILYLSNGPRIIKIGNIFFYNCQQEIFDFDIPYIPSIPEPYKPDNYKIYNLMPSAEELNKIRAMFLHPYGIPRLTD